MNLSQISRFLLFICAAVIVPSSVLRAGTEMERAFERLERDYKKLKTALESPVDTDRALYVKLTGEMRAEAQKARELEPEMIAGVPEEERTKFLARFRADMDVFIANIGKLEEALKSSRWDEAKQGMATLWQNKKEGHKAFIKQKKK